MKPLILLALLLPLAAGAKVQKCTIGGKTVYSDSQCGQDGQAITGTVNTMDTSGMREQAAKRDGQERKAQAAADAQAARSKRNSSGPCPGMEGAAYMSCQRDRLKKLKQKIEPHR